MSGITVKIDDGIWTPHLQTDTKWSLKLSLGFVAPLLKYVRVINMIIFLYLVIYLVLYTH